MSWYKASLTSTQFAAKEVQKIQNKFKKIFMNVGGPKDLALFASKFPGVKDEMIILYFSSAEIPEVELLIKACSGSPCAPPGKDEPALLAGRADAWNLLV